MAYNETWMIHDLMSAVKVKYLDGNVFSQDNAGNLIGVHLTRGGVDYDGGGTVSANVIRADGVTVAVPGTLYDCYASVVLPQAAYAVPGALSIVIKLTVDGAITTIGAMVANVYLSSTDAVVDPGTIIPSISTLIAAIDEAVASIPADYSSLWTSLAPAFDSSKSYIPGDYVTYDLTLIETTPAKVYRFVNAHTGTWVASDVVEVSLGTDIAGIRLALDGVPTRNIIDNLPFAKTTRRGVTCIKTSSGTFHLNGTKSTGTSATEFVLFRDFTALPDIFTKGETYDVDVKAGYAFVWFTAYFNNAVTGSKTMFRSNRPLNGEQNGRFTVPEDCTGCAITIRFDDASSFDEDVYIYLIERKSYEKRSALTDALVVDYSNIDDIKNLTAPMNIISSPVNGVSANKINDNSFHVEGTIETQGAWSALDLYRNKAAMPEGFVKGKTYSVYMNSKDVSLWVIKYYGEDDPTGVALWRSENNKNGDQFGTFTIPETDTEGMSIALRCDYASSFNEDVTIYISEWKTDAEKEFIATIYGSSQNFQNKRLYSIGNSFLTGIVYTDGSQSGQCSFKDAIYGQIAMGLGIGEDDTTHVYHGNTGFISPSATAQFTYDSHSDVICDTDLSGYDYCLSHCNGGDLRKPLGTVNADGTGTTLADAVVRVVNHIVTNKWICKLILLGTPPYSADYAGPNIFITPQPGTGASNSINDMDNLMYALALKYHFIYVSWQDLEISYHYMDFADYHEGDTGARHASSVNTYRALGEYASTQISAVSSPIAVHKLMTVQNS